jgi:hypothetical protein
MNLRNFFSELKRRNVYKVAIAYAVVAWLLIRVAIRTSVSLPDNPAAMIQCVRADKLCEALAALPHAACGDELAAPKT